ncbi:MAG: FG-GAP-like repeat-containing protein [Acidobacteriota bacterium]
MQHERRLICLLTILVFLSGGTSGFSAQGLGTPPPVMPGWPQVMATDQFYMPVGVVLADLDGDSDMEVAAGSSGDLFYVWDHQGTLLPGWPVDLDAKIQSKAAAADLDGDGDLDMAFTMDTGNVAIWDLPALAQPDSIEWGGLFHDNWNTGQYGFGAGVIFTDGFETGDTSAWW